MSCSEFVYRSASSLNHINYLYFYYLYFPEKYMEQSWFIICISVKARVSLNNGLMNI